MKIIKQINTNMVTANYGTDYHHTHNACKNTLSVSPKKSYIFTIKKHQPYWLVFPDSVYITIINFITGLCPSLPVPLQDWSSLRALLFSTGSPAYHSSTGYLPDNKPHAFLRSDSLIINVALRCPLWITEASCTFNASRSFTATQLQDRTPRNPLFQGFVSMFSHNMHTHHIQQTPSLSRYGFLTQKTILFSWLHRASHTQALNPVCMPEYQCGHFRALPHHSVRQAVSSPCTQGGGTFHAATHRTMAVMAIP